MQYYFPPCLPVFSHQLTDFRLYSFFRNQFVSRMSSSLPVYDIYTDKPVFLGNIFCCLTGY